jgi:hypothetical protein
MEKSTKSRKNGACASWFLPTSRLRPESFAIINQHDRSIVQIQTRYLYTTPPATWNLCLRMCDVAVLSKSIPTPLCFLSCHYAVSLGSVT